MDPGPVPPAPLVTPPPKCQPPPPVGVVGHLHHTTVALKLQQFQCTLQGGGGGFPACTNEIRLSTDGLA